MKKIPHRGRRRSLSRFQSILTVVMTAVFAFFASAAPAADVNDSMNAYWSSSMGSANITGPTAFQGQRAGYYSMGNVAVRTPQETTQIASIQMPSVRAGCGGIDIFSGGFSFINSDQLVASMKAVASNALSYAFMLALKTLSPIVSDQIESLNKLANDVNQASMSSCQTAQALVGGLWGKSDTASMQICQDLATYRGVYSDRIAARHDCPNRMNTTLSQLPAQDKKVVPINKNIAWEAAKQHPMLAGDRELAELMMTIAGTMIYRCPAGGEGCSIDAIPAAGDDDGFVAKLLDGGEISVKQCVDTENCLQLRNGTQTLTAESSIRGKVTTMMNSILGKIRTRQPLSAAEQDFLNMVSLPVYKMASVYSAQEGATAGATMAGYADIIALDLLYTWISRSVSMVEDGARNMVGIEETQLATWRNSVENLKLGLNAKQTLVAQKGTAVHAMIANTRAAEQVLAARASQRFASAVEFTSSLQTN